MKKQTKRQQPIDEEEFLRLWKSKTVTVKSIAKRLGCSYQRVNRLRRKMGLPSREVFFIENGIETKVIDPTPEQIRKRAQEIKDKHLKDKRANDCFFNDMAPSIRCYSWHGKFFSGASLLS